MLLWINLIDSFLFFHVKNNGFLMNFGDQQSAYVGIGSMFRLGIYAKVDWDLDWNWDWSKQKSWFKSILVGENPNGKDFWLKRILNWKSCSSFLFHFLKANLFNIIAPSNEFAQLKSNNVQSTWSEHWQPGVVRRFWAIPVDFGEDFKIFLASESKMWTKRKFSQFPN